MLRWSRLYVGYLEEKLTNAGSCVTLPFLLKIHGEYPTAPRAQLLQLAVFAMKTCVNEHGLTPMLLFFGMLPHLP